MNVVLIGYRGTGKSSVARIVAQRLGRKVLSTDAEVVRRANCTIPDIVEAHGWEHFRNLESEVCREVAKKDELIVDTGGGAILRPENVANLKANGKVFWLTAEVDTIASRIGTDTGRPSLTGTQTFIEEIEHVLQERLPKYHAAADHRIPTDGRTLDEIADDILLKL
jgi:shikimate kinase